jgi:hypothetical protein
MDSREPAQAPAHTPASLATTLATLRAAWLKRRPDFAQRRTDLDHLAAAIKAKDYTGAAKIDEEISRTFIEAQTAAAQDTAKAVLLTRELAGLEEQASEATWQADEALTAAKMSGDKQAIGWGSQIRSYVLDQSRIKDLRTGVETSNTQGVLDGDLDRFIEASLKAGL